MLTGGCGEFQYMRENLNRARKALAMRDGIGMSYEMIAVELGISITSASDLVEEGRKLLQIGKRRYRQRKIMGWVLMFCIPCIPAVAIVTWLVWS
jgi:transposase